MGRLTSLIELDSALSPISAIVSTYDPTGRKINNLDNGVLTTYMLDNKGRLTVQQSPGQFATFTFDAVDNALVKWYQGNPQLTMTYDAASRLVTSTFAAAATRSSYDGAGNMTAQNQAGVITGYYFDPENRLIKIMQPDGALSSYTYQGYNGLRRTNQEPGVVVHTTIWDDKANYLGWHLACTSWGTQQRR